MRAPEKNVGTVMREEREGSDSAVGESMGVCKGIMSRVMLYDLTAVAVSFFFLICSFLS